MDIRSAFFSAKNRKRKTITLTLDGEQRTLELRSCSLATREKIVKSFGDADKMRGAQKAAVLTVIACLYDPETDAPIFKDSDFALLYGDGKERPEADSCAALVEQIATEAAPMLAGPSADKCPACQAQLASGALFCQACGAKLPTPDEVAEKNSSTTPSKG